MTAVPGYFVNAYSWLEPLPAFAAAFGLIPVHVQVLLTFQEISSLIASHLKVVVVVVVVMKMLVMMMWLPDLKDVCIYLYTVNIKPSSTMLQHNMNRIQKCDWPGVPYQNRGTQTGNFGSKCSYENYKKVQLGHLIRTNISSLV